MTRAFGARLLVLTIVLWLAPNQAFAHRVLYAIAIGNNQPPPGHPDLQKLHYADDDAVRYLELFNKVGARTALLSVLDDATQARHTRWTTAARTPSWKNLKAVLGEFRTAMERDKEHGDQPVLFLTFSGHAASGADGRYALSLTDEALHRERLFEEVLRPLMDVDVHLIIDACHAAGVVGLRGPGVELEAERVPLSQEALEQVVEQGSLSQFPRAGALVASTLGQEAHEWSRLESGVFTHEILSALSGAADINGDLRIEYSEVEAFVSAANHGIENVRAQPQIVAHAPLFNRRSVLLDLNELQSGSRLLRGRPLEATHFQIELKNGQRYLDAHPGPGTPLALLLPSGAGHFVRTDHSEAELPPDGENVDLGSLEFRPLQTRARGSVEQALHAGLFATPFGLEYYRGYVDSRRLASVTLPGLSADSAPHTSPQVARSVSIAAYAVAGAGVVAAGVSFVFALVAKSRFDDTQLQREAHEQETRYRRALITGLSTLGAGIAAGATGWLLWPSASAAADHAEVQLNMGGRF